MKIQKILKQKSDLQGPYGVAFVFMGPNMCSWALDFY